ncbi:MAG: hypothetical protein EAZ08_13620 [Cytophagales bacterium]|nr:MAG: hypothetical protein EAZ08_13620 [Cytophagales bacterium]
MFTQLFISVSLLLMPAISHAPAAFFQKEKHPIHLSVSDIEYNSKDKSLEIVHKVFIDDFEKILETNYKTRLHIATPKENPATDKYIIDYLEKNFVLEINGKVQKVDFHGKFNNDKEDIFAIWILAKIEHIGQIKSVKLRNTMLMDLYDDQDNFVHVKYLGQRKSMRFKGRNQEDEIEF